jgi:hypothetical protein
VSLIYLQTCAASALQLKLANMLRRFSMHTPAAEVTGPKLERKQSKRQRVLRFFRTKKQKSLGHDEVTVRSPHFAGVKANGDVPGGDTHSQ